MGQMSRIHFAEDNPVLIPPIQFCPRTAKLVKTQYVNNLADALIGVDPETGERLWTATVNIPDAEPAEGCVWIKNYGENEGMIDALAQAGVIQFTGTFAQVGHEHAFECALLI